MTSDWNQRWHEQITKWAAIQMVSADSGHGMDHVQRVVANAIHLGEKEAANMAVVLPAAWLHDCVVVPKNSPLRSKASAMAAERAVEFLSSIQYPQAWLEPIAHCILAHSFSANRACETVEARVLQDADRMEAIGAIGIARCLMTGGAMKQRLYDPVEPFPCNRPVLDSVQSIDHFFAKLLGLAATMQTRSGKEMAKDRTAFMVQFLEELASEIGLEPRQLKEAIETSQRAIRVEDHRTIRVEE